MNSTATAQLNNFCRAALRNSFTLSPLLHATSLTAMRRHGVLGPLGLGSQAPPLPHCILPYGADARVHAEHGVPGTRSCGLFCLSAELDSSPSRGLPLLLPFVRHRLSDSSPFRGLPLSARSCGTSGASALPPGPFCPLCGTSGASALPLGAGLPLFCPFMALPRLAALAERQLCRT